MTCSPLVSDLIASVRDTFKTRVHDGVWLSQEEVYGLIRNLNTIHHLAIEIEDEKSILERQLRLSSLRSVPIAVPAGGNVVRLPVRQRFTVVGGTDGGDVA